MGGSTELYRQTLPFLPTCPHAHSTQLPPHSRGFRISQTPLLQRPRVHLLGDIHWPLDDGICRHRDMKRE